MKKLHLTALAGFLAVGIFSPITIQAAQAKKDVGVCPRGYKIEIRRRQSLPYVTCYRVVRKKVKHYAKNYRPCPRPYIYRPSFERPRGKDRCRRLAALPGTPAPATRFRKAKACPSEFPERLIRRRKVDRCYKVKLVKVKKYANLKLIQKVVKPKVVKKAS